MIYRIGLTQTVLEGVTVRVEATSADAAIEAAIALANAGDVDWSFIEASGPVEVVSLDEEAVPVHIVRSVDGVEWLE
jgi:hypothetical protein